MAKSRANFTTQENYESYLAIRKRLREPLPVPVSARQEEYARTPQEEEFVIHRVDGENGPEFKTTWLRETYARKYREGRAERSDFRTQAEYETYLEERKKVNERTDELLKHLTDRKEAVKS